MPGLLRPTGSSNRSEKSRIPMNLRLPIEVTDGKLVLDRSRLEAWLKGKAFRGHLMLTDEPLPKSLRQLGAFWAALIPQVQQHKMDTDGIFVHEDRIKESLKSKFLSPVKRYYSDGSPVFVRVPHPEKKGIFWDWHLEEIPSMAELSLEKMTSFMSEIIHYYWHEEGLQITIKQ